MADTLGVWVSPSTPWEKQKNCSVPERFFSDLLSGQTGGPLMDLHIVLSALAGAPFEPIGSASLQYLTWKMAFLLAITSTARVSELQALDSHPDLYRVVKSCAILRLNPAFIPKSL